MCTSKLYTWNNGTLLVRIVYLADRPTHTYIQQREQGYKGRQKVLKSGAMVWYGAYKDQISIGTVCK